MINKEDVIQKLETFQRKLRDYRHYRLSKDNRCYSLRNILLEDAGRLRALVTELTGKEKIILTWKSGQESSYDIWFKALQLQFNEDVSFALDCGIDLITVAIGKLKADIEMGIRDEQGNVIQKLYTTPAKPPKAFIAHGGKSGVLDKLREFIQALGIDPLIVELLPSKGMSVDEKVNKYIKDADCGIVLATKGGIVDTTGNKPKQHPRLNVIDEFERLRTTFPNKTILLLEKGVDLPSNISSFTYEPFARQSMDRAFTAIARELTAFGILKATKPQE
jgi:predicted nucleotide-binding protein